MCIILGSGSVWAHRNKIKLVLENGKTGGLLLLLLFVIAIPSRSAFARGNARIVFIQGIQF